jgi:S1-C subfamily serine protease
VGVASVEKDSGAQRAGIRSGDVIQSINGKKTPTMAELAETISALKPGDQVKVGVLRANGRTETVTVTLGQLPGE